MADARFEPPLEDTAADPVLVPSRAAWLARAVASLRETPPAGIPQHRLLVGAAGTGKSLALRALALAETGFTAIALPPELGEVLSVDSLWRAAARALDPSFSGDGLHGLVAAARGRRIAVLIDDLDRLLSRLDGEHWALREALSSRTDVALIGTCRRLPETTVRYDGAFYDFFAIDRLESFSAEETAEFLGAIDTPTSRALHDLCGGAPRRIAELRELARDPALDAGRGLCALLDHAEPEHRAVLDALSDQTRAVLLALANVGDPASAADVAARLGMPSNKASAYLNRLGADGLIEKVPLPDARSTGYQVVDRLLALRCRARSGDRAAVLDLARATAEAWAVARAPRSATAPETDPHRAPFRQAREVAADPERIAATPPELRAVVRALVAR